MLQRKYRLSSKTKLANTNSFPTPFFLLRVAANGLVFNRYGFVVSKKIDKRAVVRNKIKRKIRSCIEKDLNNIKPGYDMLFVIRGNFLDMSTESICLSIQKILKKENFLL